MPAVALGSAAAPGSSAAAELAGAVELDEAAEEDVAGASALVVEGGAAVVLNGAEIDGELAAGGEDVPDDARDWLPTGEILARTTKQQAAISPMTMATTGAISLSFWCLIPLLTQSRPIWFTRSAPR